MHATGSLTYEVLQYQCTKCPQKSYIINILYFQYSLQLEASLVDILPFQLLFLLGYAAVYLHKTNPRYRTLRPTHRWFSIFLQITVVFIVVRYDMLNVKQSKRYPSCQLYALMKWLDEYIVAASNQWNVNITCDNRW